jgi:hypothetical protein
MAPIIITAAALAILTVGIAAPRFPEFHRRWRDRRRSEAAKSWQVQAVRDLAVAEDLLDLLEARGVATKELVVLGNSEFEVRWRK